MLEAEDETGVNELIQKQQEKAVDENQEQRVAVQPVNAFFDWASKPLLAASKLSSYVAPTLATAGAAMSTAAQTLTHGVAVSLQMVQNRLRHSEASTENMPLDRSFLAYSDDLERTQSQHEQRLLEHRQMREVRACYIAVYIGCVELMKLCDRLIPRWQWNAQSPRPSSEAVDGSIPAADRAVRDVAELVSFLEHCLTLWERFVGALNRVTEKVRSAWEPQIAVIWNVLDDVQRRVDSAFGRTIIEKYEPASVSPTSDVPPAEVEVFEDYVHHATTVVAGNDAVPTPPPPAPVASTPTATEWLTKSLGSLPSNLRSVGSLLSWSNFTPSVVSVQKSDKEAVQDPS